MMARYIARRVLEATLTLLAVGFATFGLLHALPYNLAAIMAGPTAPPAVVAQVAREMGLNLPLPAQFGLWLRQLAATGLPLAARFAPLTLELLVLGSVLAAVAAFAMAFAQARRPNSLIDRAASLAAYVAYALPSFWVGFVLIYVFALQLLWLPATGPNLDPSSQGIANWATEMVLPAMTLALSTIALWLTYFGGAIEEALHSEYVRTARAKGLSEGRVILAHVLRNALLPAITIAGMSLPTLFNNVIVVEWVFAMQGLGSELIYSLTGFDYSRAVDLVMVIGAFTILGSLVADLLYALADPRIKFS